MGINILEFSKIRKRKIENENRNCRRLEIKPLTQQELIKRRSFLNKSNFKSKLWFQKALINNFKNKEFSIFKNYPILNKFFTDFYFPDIRLVVEIDVSTHDDKESYDTWRDSLFIKHGLTVFRIKYECNIQLINCLDYIHREFEKKELLRIVMKKPYLKYRKKRKEKKQIIEKDKELLWALGKAISPYKKIDLLEKSDFNE